VSVRLYALGGGTLYCSNELTTKRRKIKNPRDGNPGG
jgi:hypothetical protein